MTVYGLERPYGMVVLNCLDLHRFGDSAERNAWAEQRPRPQHSAGLQRLLGAQLLDKLTRTGRRDRLYEPLPVYVQRAIRLGGRTPSLWRPVAPGHDKMPITILGNPRKE